MSSSDLAEAGVLGLDEYLPSTKPGSPCALGSVELERESEACADELHTKPTLRTKGSFQGRPDLLTELRNVSMLDELIMEENLQIHKLRHGIESHMDEPLRSKHLETQMPLVVNEGTESFQLQLEKEKSEVEKLDKSLNRERTLEKKEDKVGDLVSCSTTEKSEMEDQEHQDSCDEVLIDGCDISESRHSTQVQNDSELWDASQTETFHGASSLDVVKVLKISQDQKLTGSEAEQSLCDRTTFNSTLDLKQLSDVTVQPKQCTSEKELEEFTEKARAHGPEASVSSEMKLDEGALDSGAKPTPLPPQRSSVLGINSLTEVEAPDPTEFCPAASLTVQHLGYDEQLDLKDKSLDFLPENITPDLSESFVLNPNIKEHSNNNNNHGVQQNSDGSLKLTEIPCKAEKTSVGPAHFQQMDVQPTEELLQFVHQVQLDQVLEFDPGRPDELPEDLPDAVQSSEAVRVSDSGSPRMQTKFNDNLTAMAHFKTPIVMDTGSGLMKAGFADKELPSIIFPTIIGIPKYEEIMNGNLEKESYIGHDAQHMRGVLLLKHPIKNGIIRNWDDMEKIWHHTFQQLFVEPEDHPVLLTEAAMNPLENRQRMVEMMFECFNVPFTYVAMQAVLALYGAGRTTGVVFDSGDGVSHSVPVFEGYCLPHAVQRFPLAGADVTMHLKKEQGVCMRTTAEEEIVREMKEKCCYVALKYDTEQSQAASPCRDMHYTMPDGQIVTVDTERFRAPEILFKPELIGRDHHGMHESVFKSVLSSDIDLRRLFLENIVLSGGNTLLPGLPERLQTEIMGLVPADMGVNVRVTSPKDRDFLVWSGGAVLASLPTFGSAWISQEEYEEYGPQIVFRKCF